MSLCRGRKQRLSRPVVRPGLPPALLQGFVFLAGRVRIWAVSPPSPFKDLVSSEATWGTPWEVRRVIFPNQEARASPGADLPRAIVLTPVGRRGRSLRAAWGCGPCGKLHAGSVRRRAGPVARIPGTCGLAAQSLGAQQTAFFDLTPWWLLNSECSAFNRSRLRFPRLIS